MRYSNDPSGFKRSLAAARALRDASVPSQIAAWLTGVLESQT